MNLEEQAKAKLAQSADQYYETYRDYMDQLDKSLLGKVRGSITEADVYALGSQLAAAEDHFAMVEEEGNRNLLGKLPNIGLDVLTAVAGSSVMNIIATVQSIPDEQGIVYFRQVRAADTKGNMTAGDVTSDPRNPHKSGSGYASNELVSEVGDSQTGTDTVFSFVLAAKPIRAETLKVRLSTGGSVEGADIGAGTDSNVGRIWGNGVSGTVNYTTGQVDLTFTTAPTNPSDILCDYQQNYELSTDIPQMDSYFASTSVFAKTYALKGTFGMLQSYAMKKRFGKMAEDEAAKDLVSEINKEIGADLIKKLRADAQGTTQFDRTPLTNVSKFENRMEIKQALANASATLQGNAGRGDINILIAGRTQATTLSTLPGFSRMGDAAGVGPKVIGKLDGITIIQVNEAAVLGAEEGVGLYKGSSPFESASVWAPYMPLTSTGVLPTSPNPLNSQRAVAVVGATKTIVPNFATKLDFITS